jgi:Tfp pilus assembly protein PilE
MDKPLGFSLIELNISLAAGTLLLAVIFVAYSSTYRAWRQTQAQTNLAEQALVIDTQLRSDMAMAGYAGCRRADIASPIKQLSEGALQITHMAADSVAVRFVAGISNTLYLPKRWKLKIGDRLMIADCDHSQIFQIKNLKPAGKFIKVQSATPLKGPCLSNAQVAPLWRIEFYFKPTRGGKFQLLTRLNHHPAVVMADDIQRYHWDTAELAHGIVSLDLELQKNQVSKALRFIYRGMG